MQSVAAHTRRASSGESVGEAESVPFFDEARVPIETIPVPNREIEGLSADQFEVIGEKASYRLAQRPGRYVVLKYIRTLVKRKDTQTIHCPPAPQGVIEGSRADVSFLAGLIVDKMAYHLPLYRQHQRLGDSGIRVSRAWLTQLIQQGIGLLEPIYAAQFDSIRNSRVKAMDETPIRAGRSGRGKMKTGYFWPVYGGEDEVCFPFFPFETRKAVLHAWLNIADSLDIQGEPILACDVRHFARHLPRVLTDREHVAAALVAHFQQWPAKEATPNDTRDKTREFTR